MKGECEFAKEVKEQGQEKGPRASRGLKTMGVMPKYQVRRGVGLLS